jgi:hypothetical protein
MVRGLSAADLDRQPHDRVAVDTCQPLNAADAVAFNEQVSDGLLLSFLRRRSAGTLKPNNNKPQTRLLKGWHPTIELKAARRPLLNP